MKLPWYSVDGGDTWHEIKGQIRISYPLADDNELDLIATSEGIILDVVSSNGDVRKTASLLVDDLVDQTQ